MVSDSSTGSAPSAKKPRKAITASEGIVPPAAWPSRRMSRVVSEIRKQRHEHRACETREFPKQRPVEDHAILSLWNLA